MININKIAISNLKHSKLKSIVTSITIVLTTCLLVSVGIITLNMVNQFKIDAVRTAGNSHASYTKLAENQIDIIRKHSEIESVGENSSEIGKITVGKTDLTLFYSDENWFKFSNQNILEGKLPKLKNEIALDKEMITDLGSEATLGNKIKLKFNDINGNIIEEEFVLSGIIERSEYNVIKNDSDGIISKEFISQKNYDTSYKATVRLKNEENLSAQEIESKVNHIAKELNLYNDSDNIKMNKIYLMSKKPDLTTIVGGVVTTLIIILTSCIVIYNIFYISVINKTQEIGKLKAIGSTKKQIKNIILKEGLILSMVSIPIGLILGYIVSNLILKLLMYDINVDIEDILLIIISTTILTIITVYIGIIRPMKLASKVSPIEAMKYNESFIPTRKSRKGYLEIDIKKLAYSSLFRNKKRTYLTLISISLSGILFVSISTVLQSINAEQIVKQSMTNDFEFKLKYATYDHQNERAQIATNNPFNSSFISDIESLKGVDNVNVVNVITCDMNIFGKEHKEGELAGFDDDMLNRASGSIESGKINIEKIKSGDEIIISTFAHDVLGLNVGDSITLKYDNLETTITKEVNIGAVVSIYIGSPFITSNDLIKNTDSNNYTQLIQVEAMDVYYDSVNDVLRDISQNYNNLEYSDFKGELKLYTNAFFGVKTMGYGLVGIIGIISLVNLANTIITSVISRKKELGMMQAIGMSNKQLKNMLQIEYLFYIGISIVISLAIGSVLGYFIYRGLYNMGIDYAVYKYPLIPILVLIMVSVFAQMGIKYFIKNHFKRESLIDRVKYSE